MCYSCYNQGLAREGVGGVAPSGKIFSEKCKGGTKVKFTPPLPMKNHRKKKYQRGNQDKNLPLHEF
jgi:hypothetical protein